MVSRIAGVAGFAPVLRTDKRLAALAGRIEMKRRTDRADAEQGAVFQEFNFPASDRMPVQRTRTRPEPVKPGPTGPKEATKSAVKHRARRGHDGPFSLGEGFSEGWLHQVRRGKAKRLASGQHRG